RGFESGSVVRSCTIPMGTALFFPLINAFYGAFLTDAPETRTEEFLRAQMQCQNVVLRADIDGIAVTNPLQYFEQSLLFDVQLPEDKVLGVSEDDIPALLLSPSVPALRPLRGVIIRMRSPPALAAQRSRTPAQDALERIVMRHRASFI